LPFSFPFSVSLLKIISVIYTDVSEEAAMAKQEQQTSTEEELATHDKLG
jgi:hypothetical protein